MKKIVYAISSVVMLDLNAMQMQRADVAEMFSKYNVLYKDYKNNNCQISWLNEIISSKEPMLIGLSSNSDNVRNLLSFRKYLYKLILKNNKTVSQINVLYNQFLDTVLSELDDSSRSPTMYEINASRSLKSIFSSLGVQVDEIRFMDASSLISGMNIASDRKSYLISFLEPRTDLNPLLKELADKRQFSDARLKERILQDIREGAAQSKIYRDLFVTFIARIESTPALSAQIAYDPEIISAPVRFEFGEESQSLYNVITINYEDNVYYRSLFPHFSARAKISANLYCYLILKRHILFHELGHSISAHFSQAAAKINIDKTMSVASTFTVVNVDQQALQHLANIVKETPEFHEDCIKGATRLSEQAPQNMDINKAIEIFAKASSSPERIAKKLFSNSMEVWQIFGINMFKQNGKSTLYINLLSDFALYTLLGLPIRCDHRGYFEENSESGTLPQVVTYQILNPLYNAFLNVYGSNLYEYSLKLMFPNGLLSALKAEYKLWNTALGNEIVKRLHP